MTVSHTRTVTTTKRLQREIAGQMRDLPLEELLTLREFTAFLHQRAQRDPAASAAPFRRPTVEVPADSLLGLTDLLPPVGGDALADTEALYDHV